MPGEDGVTSREGGSRGGSFLPRHLRSRYSEVAPAQQSLDDEATLHVNAAASASSRAAGRASDPALAEETTTASQVKSLRALARRGVTSTGDAGTRDDRDATGTPRSTSIDETGAVQQAQAPRVVAPRIPKRLSHAAREGSDAVPTAKPSTASVQPTHTPAHPGHATASEPRTQEAQVVSEAEPVAGTPVVPPRFIPQLDRELLKREDQRQLRLDKEKVAKSSSREVLPEMKDEQLDREVRTTRRARRRFRSRVFLAGAVLAVAAFIVGAIVNPFAKRAPSPEELAASKLSHPSPTGVPYAALEAGQCFSTFTNAWAAEWQTTECTGEHAAEFLAEVPAHPYKGGAYPGEEQLRARAQLSCQDPSVLDEKKAKKVDKLVIDVRYAASQAEWDAGLQSYACFAARSDGGSWSGSLAA